MTRLQVWLGAAVLVLAAGCVSGPAAKPTGPAPSSASVTADTGGIDGRITTDELQPIVNAQVALANQNKTTVTATDGSFSFSGLAPGTYVVNAGAVGYYQGTKTVEVSAGELRQMNMILDRVPIDSAPIEEVMKFTGNLPVNEAGCNAGEQTWPQSGVGWIDYTIPINDTKDNVALAATRIVIDLTTDTASSTGTVDVDMHLNDPAGKEIGSGTTADPNEHLEINKLLGLGAYTLHVILCLGANAHFSIKATIHYETGQTAEYVKTHGGKKPGES